MRLFSQLAQDCQLKVGKVLWIAGHSGPETAEDSRTHFGIFSPGVTQFFPKGQMINLHPWEYNEVPVLLGAALKQDAPIVALHLTRPNIQVPDRAALGMPSHFEAARGAYVVRDYRPGQPRGGTILVQGTSAMASIVKVLPELDARGLNVKVICTTSPQLFALQPAAYRDSVLGPGDRLDSTVITTQARWLMHDWICSTRWLRNMPSPRIGTIGGAPGARWKKCSTKRISRRSGCWRGSSALCASDPSAWPGCRPTWMPPEANCECELDHGAICAPRQIRLAGEERHMATGTAIVSVEARQVFSDRGHPGVEATVTTASGAQGVAICTAGVSVGTHEVEFAYDGGTKWRGKGVQRAVNSVNEVIAPALEGWMPATSWRSTRPCSTLAGRSQGAPGRQRHGSGLGGGAQGRRGGVGHPALPAHRRRQRLHPARAGRPSPGGQRPLRRRRALRRQAQLLLHGLWLRHLLRGLLRLLGHLGGSGRRCSTEKFGVPKHSVTHAPAVPAGDVKDDREIWDLMVETIAKAGLRGQDRHPGGRGRRDLLGREHRPLRRHLLRRAQDQGRPVQALHLDGQGVPLCHPRGSARRGRLRGHGAS